MASADFCSSLTTLLSVASLHGRLSRPPRVRRVTFLPYTRRIYAPSVRMASGFGSFGPLAHLQDASMRFVFLGPGVCLQLPSHPASRRRGCCSA